MKNRLSSLQRRRTMSLHINVVSMSHWITKALLDSDLKHSKSKQIINLMSLFETHVSLLQPLSVTSVSSHSLTETFDRTQNFRLSACLHLCTLDGAFYITFGTFVLVVLRVLLVIGLDEDHFFYWYIIVLWCKFKRIRSNCWENVERRILFFFIDRFPMRG